MNTTPGTTPQPWTGHLPVDDTALYVTDTGGDGIPVVYLNGSYASMRHWNRVIRELGFGGTENAVRNATLLEHGLTRIAPPGADNRPPAYRHIAYDERARGRSKRSADYSFEAALRDLDVVLKTRRIERPILVGWSYGALLAVHWAGRNPDRVASIVSVDGAMPVPEALRHENPPEAIRQLFRKMRWFLPLAAQMGLAARMSAVQHAEVNIEANSLLLESQLVPVLDRITTPVHYIVAKGEHTGSRDGQMEQVRAALEPVLAREKNLTVSSRVPSNHEAILRKNSPAVAQAIREVAAIQVRG